MKTRYQGRKSRLGVGDGSNLRIKGLERTTGTTDLFWPKDVPEQEMLAAERNLEIITQEMTDSMSTPALSYGH